MIVNIPHKIPDKHDMIRANRPTKQLHLRFRRSPIPLLIITADTCANEIIPGIKSTACPRDHVIHRQRDIGPPAILAAVAVATKDVFAGKDDFLERNTDVHTEANDTREWHRSRHGMQEPSI